MIIGDCKVRFLIVNSLLTLMLLITSSAYGNAFEDANKAYEFGNYTEAIKLFKPLALKGNADAAYTLGEMYQKGQGVTQDDTKALKWFKLAAEKGHFLAGFEVYYAQNKKPAKQAKSRKVKSTPEAVQSNRASESSAEQLQLEAEIQTLEAQQAQYVQQKQQYEEQLRQSEARRAAQAAKEQDSNAWNALINLGLGIAGSSSRQSPANITMPASPHYLSSQWYDGGNTMCRYDDGTVLNMGSNICPLSR